MERVNFIEKSRFPCLLLVMLAIGLRLLADAGEVAFWIFVASLFLCTVRCCFVSRLLAVYGPAVWFGVAAYYSFVLLGYDFPALGWVGLVLDESVTVWMVLVSVVYRDDHGVLRIVSGRSR